MSATQLRPGQGNPPGKHPAAHRQPQKSPINVPRQDGSVENRLALGTHGAREGHSRAQRAGHKLPVPGNSTQHAGHVLTARKAAREAEKQRVVRGSVGRKNRNRGVIPNPAESPARGACSSCLGCPSKMLPPAIRAQPSPQHPVNGCGRLRNHFHISQRALSLQAPSPPW